MLSQFISLIGLLFLSFMCNVGAYIYGFGLTVQSWGALLGLWAGQMALLGIIRAISKEIGKDKK